jgi:hypothetical protein
MAITEPIKQVTPQPNQIQQQADLRQTTVKPVTPKPVQQGLYKEGPQSALGKQLSLRGISYTPEDHQAITDAENAYTTASRGNDKAGMSAANAAAEAIRAKYGFSGGADGNTFKELSPGSAKPIGGTITPPVDNTVPSTTDPIVSPTPQSNSYDTYMKDLETSKQDAMRVIDESTNLSREQQERQKADVQRQYDKDVEVINANMYNQFEGAKAQGAQRGLDYSAQQQALNQGVYSRATRQKIDAASNRDLALQNINSRIDDLLRQASIDKLKTITDMNSEAARTKYEYGMENEKWDKQIKRDDAMYERDRGDVLEDRDAAYKREDANYQRDITREDANYQRDIKREDANYNRDVKREDANYMRDTKREDALHTRDRKEFLSDTQSDRAWQKEFANFQASLSAKYSGGGGGYGGGGYSSGGYSKSGGSSAAKPTSKQLTTDYRDASGWIRTNGEKISITQRKGAYDELINSAANDDRLDAATKKQVVANLTKEKKLEVNKAILSDIY